MSTQNDSTQSHNETLQKQTYIDYVTNELEIHYYRSGNFRVFKFSQSTHFGTFHEV